MIGLRVTKGDVSHVFTLCEGHADDFETFVAQTCRAERVPAPPGGAEIPAWGRTLLDGYACASQLGLPLKEPPVVSPKVPPTYVGMRCAEITVVEGSRVPYATAAVWILREGETRELDPRLGLRNHSPTGFEWGYGGSGPAQLALAILADALSEDVALDHYQDFKARIVAHLPKDNWVMPQAEVKRWASGISSRT